MKISLKRDDFPIAALNKLSYNVLICYKCTLHSYHYCFDDIIIANFSEKCSSLAFRGMYI